MLGKASYCYIFIVYTTIFSVAIDMQRTHIPVGTYDFYVSTQ